MFTKVLLTLYCRSINIKIMLGLNSTPISGCGRGLQCDKEYYRHSWFRVRLAKTSEVHLHINQPQVSPTHKELSASFIQAINVYYYSQLKTLTTKSLARKERLVTARKLPGVAANVRTESDPFPSYRLALRTANCCTVTHPTLPAVV
jgi:hypothetical protein